MRGQIAGRGLIAAALGLVWNPHMPAARGQDAPATDAQEDAEQSARLAERNRLWKLSQQFAAAGDHAAAISAAEQMVAIEIEFYGPAHQEIAYSYGWLAGQQAATGDYESAAALYDRRVEVLAQLSDVAPWTLTDARLDAANSRLLAAMSPDELKSYDEAGKLAKQVFALFDAGDYKAAQEAAAQSLQLFRQILGPDHPRTARAMSITAQVLVELGEFDAARTLYQDALAVRRRALGEVHAATAWSLHDLAMLHDATGDFEQALTLAKQALAVRKRVLGDRHQTTAISVAVVARILRAQGQYQESLELYRQSLEIVLETLGEESRDAATGTSNLASAYRAVGDAHGSLEHAEKAVELCRRAFGEKHAQTARAIDGLAHSYSMLGMYERAVVASKQALAIRRETLGDSHRETADSFNNLAALYLDIDDYARAIPLLERGLEIAIAALGDDHPDVAGSLANLAHVYEMTGEYVEARPLLERALAITRQRLGAQHPDAATTMSNLASLLINMGKVQDALPLYEQAIAVFRVTLGDHHPDMPMHLNNLARAYYYYGDDERAIASYKEALAISPRETAEWTSTTATVAGNLAFAYLRRGEYERARPLFNQAAETAERIFGPRSQAVAHVAVNRAALEAATGERDAALEHLAQAAAMQREVFEGQFLSLTESQIRSLYNDVVQIHDALVTLALQRGQTTDVLQELLARKAVAFEVLQRRRAAQARMAVDAEFREAVQQLQATQQAVENLTLRAPGESSAAETAGRLEQLTQDEQRLQTQINRQLAEMLAAEDASLAVPLSAVTARVGGGAALVDYIVYRPFHFQAAADEPFRGEPRYLAIVATGDAGGKASAVDLGPAREIDELIAEANRLVVQFGREARFADEQDAENAYRETAAALQQRLFAPLRSALGAARLVFVGCDGRLSQIPFETLVTASGDYLLEDGFRFAYLNSGRDLLRTRDELGSGVAVLAAPDYRLAYQERIDVAAGLLEDDRPLLAEQQPAAERIAGVDAISRYADTRRGWRDLGEAALLEGDEAAAAFRAAGVEPVAVFTRGQALEEVVKRLASPRTLVLITHGDYLENAAADVDPEGATGSLAASFPRRGGTGVARSALRAVENPLLRSYLVLAGANRVDEQIPNSVHVENGWLTAQEIAQLDLRGTDLVVLSACSTNRGDANNGQAVAGMRSAFLFAGARTIVGSLFEVPNAETRQLLKPFYEGVAAGEGKLAALNAAKLAFIKDRRGTDGAAHPFYWASFILVGEP